MFLVGTESRRPTISFHKIPTFIAYFLVGFGMKRASAKEPVGKKNSGLGKLMSVLHQNAASLVNTKAEHNGPDQVLTAAEFTSSVRNKAVTLRREEAGLGAEEPLSVPSLLQQVSVS